MKPLKLLVDIPEGHKWYKTEKLTKNKLQITFVPIHRNCDCKYCN